MRLTEHLQNSAIKEHMTIKHFKNLTRIQLEKNVKIILGKLNALKYTYI